MNKINKLNTSEFYCCLSFEMYWILFVGEVSFL